MVTGSSQEFRPVRALTISAARWSGRMPDSAPLIRPIGVRHASTAKTALIASSSLAPVGSSPRLPAPALDERGQGGHRRKCVKVQVLRRDVHPVPAVHL